MGEGGGWRVVSLASLCAQVTSGGTPSRKRSDYYVDRANGIPWLKTQELTDRVLYNAEEYISEEALANSSAKVLPAGTVLIAMYGATAGQLGYLAKPMACNQACCALLVNESKANARFIYYLLRNERQRLKSLANGAAQQNLNVRTISGLQFPLPPLPEQRAIAEVLGALDDKIEANRRIGNLIDETLRALYEYYAAQSFEGRIGDMVQPFRCRLRDRRFPVLSAVASGELVRSDAFFKKRVYSEDISKYLEVPRWGFAYNPSRANIGSIGLNYAFDAGAVSPVYVVVSSTRVRAWWVREALRSEKVRLQIQTLSSGSVRQVLSEENFLSITIPLPSADGLTAFNKAHAPIWERQVVAARENDTLSALRDALLPKLLSGELRVKDAEPLVETAL